MSESIPVSLGRYVIQGEIGRGMMGAVYRATDPDLGRTVALKTVRLAFPVSNPDREQFEQRFLAEARAAAQLSHTGIVVVHDVGRDAETQTLFIALEYLEGRTLEQATADGPIEWREAARIAARIAEALHHAHSRGIVHRDVKPANIMLLPSGEPKIMDFGIAKLPASQLTLAGQCFGTPAYMSPEQATGAETDGRSDLFSLGAILYQMLTGLRPFTGGSVPAILVAVQAKDPPAPSSALADIPTALDYVVARALSKTPEQRYRDGASLADDLADVLAGRPPRHRAGWKAAPRAEAASVPAPPSDVSAGAAPAHEERRSDRESSRWSLVAGAGFLTVVSASVIIGLWSGRRQTLPRDAADAHPAPATQPAAPAPASDASPANTKPWAIFPTLGEPAELVIDVEHSLKSGRIRVWVDDDLMLDRPLQARVRKQILVYKSRKGALSRSVDVEPGEHVVRVQVDSGDTALTDQVKARFARGVTTKLKVDVGGLLKKHLSLSWG
jgi:serine/threonine protein kinase